MAKPKKKKAIHDRIPIKVKLTKRFYLSYWLRYLASGNGFLTSLIMVLFIGLFVWASKDDLIPKTLKASGQARQVSIVTTSNNLSECPPQLKPRLQGFFASQCTIKAKEAIFGITFFYTAFLLVIALTYWIPLMKMQRNLVGREDHRRIKYWLYLLAVLRLYWWAFQINAGFGLLALIIGRFFVIKQPDNEPYFLEGRESMKYAQAKGFYRLFLTPEMTSYPFGGVEISAFDATRSFLFLGRAGSGKSLSMALLMLKVLLEITSGSGKRAIINDHNQSILPEIYGMGVDCTVYILNPLDARGYAWDLAADFQDPDQLLQLASIFVQKSDDKQNDFFNSAVRICFFAITYLFSQTAPKKWRLRDVLIALFSRDYLLALLGNTTDPNVRKAIEVLGGSNQGKIGSEKQAAGVMGTTITLLDKFSTIAALSDYHIQAGRKFSLAQWSKEASIALLGNSVTSSEAIGVLNQAFIHRSCEIILEMEESKVACNFLFLDEFVGLGKQHKIPKLALEGRKRGVCLVLGIQSVADVFHLYGREQTESLLGQIEHKAILSVSDRISAEWASQVIGSQTTWDGENPSSIKTKDVVPASEFIDLPVINPRLEIGLKGFYSSKVVHSHTYAFSYLKKTILPPDESVPKFIPAPSKYKHLKDWDESDIARLGIGDLLKGKSPEKPVDYGKINDFFNRKNPESDMTDISDLSA